MAGTGTLPKVQVSGGLNDIINLFTSIAPQFGSGKQTTTDVTSGSTTTTSTAQMDPAIQGQVDEIMKAIQASGDPATLDALVQNIFAQAKEQFAPVLGNYKAAGGYNDTVLKQMAENAQARAVGEAAKARLDVTQNVNQLTASLAKAKLDSATTIAANNRTVTTPGTSRTVTAQTGASPAGKAMGIGAGALQALALLKKKGGTTVGNNPLSLGLPEGNLSLINNAVNPLDVSMASNGIPQGADIIDNVAQPFDELSSTADQLVNYNFDEFSSILDGGLSIGENLNFASEAISGVDEFLGGASGAVYDVAPDVGAAAFDEVMGVADSSWLDDVMNFFSFADGGKVGKVLKKYADGGIVLSDEEEQRKRTDFRTRINQQRDPTGRGGGAQDNPLMQRMQQVVSNATQQTGKQRKKQLDGLPMNDEAGEVTSANDSPTSTATGTPSLSQAMALATLFGGLLTTNPMMIANAFFSLSTGKSATGNILSVLTGKTGDAASLVNNVSIPSSPELAGVFEQATPSTTPSQSGSVSVGNPGDVGTENIIEVLADMGVIDPSTMSQDQINAVSDIYEINDPATFNPADYSFDSSGAAPTSEAGYEAAAGGYGVEPGMESGFGEPGEPGGWKDGGKINGKGTGISDSNIIRVSDDEYIVPADVVALPGVEAFLDNLLKKYHTPVNRSTR